MKISVVIPCYKSSRTIRKVVEMTAAELEGLGYPDYEFVLVDDCSPDGGETAAELKQLSHDHGFVRSVLLAKNAGQHNALMAALNFAEGDILIGMDDDMQTHPSQIRFLLEEFNKGYDIVYGYYPEKKHSGFRNLGSYINYLSVRILIGKPKELKTSSFWVIRKFVRDSVIEYKNPYAYLQGLFLRTTRNISCIPIKHFEREVGNSGYTFSKLVKLWSNIMGFSVVPLRMATWLGGFFAALGMLGAVVVLIRKLMIPTMAMGWPSMMVAICFFSGVNLMVLGLVGEYVGRMFLGLNREPQYVVREIWQETEKPKVSADICDENQMCSNNFVEEIQQ